MVPIAADRGIDLNDHGRSRGSAIPSERRHPVGRGDAAPLLAAGIGHGRTRDAGRGGRCLARAACLLRGLAAGSG